MFVTEAKIQRAWTPITNFMEVEADAEYTLINNSRDKVFFIESDALPEDTVTGAPVMPNCYASYKPGAQTLYVRNGQKTIMKDGVVQDTRTSLITINKVG